MAGQEHFLCPKAAYHPMATDFMVNLISLSRCSTMVDEATPDQTVQHFRASKPIVASQPSGI